MDLVNEYLRAVAALLPKAQREDIVAELRDTILTRIEAREGELGRPLTDDEIEAVLREIGHPVVVAARYREGPQHVVGPTLYPYWLFAVKAAITLQVVVALVVVFMRTVAFGDFGGALGRAIGSGVSGALVLIGAATCAAWFIERHGARIDYLDKWRVRDLRMLEIASWDFSTWWDWFMRQTGYPHRPDRPDPPRAQPQRPGPQGPGPQGPAGHQRARDAAARPAQSTAAAPAPMPFPPPPPWHPAMRSMARGMGYIALGTLLVLWWTGLLPLGLGLEPTDWAALDLDPGALAKVDWVALRAMLFLPVLGYAAAILLQGVIMIADPYSARLQGLIEAARGGVLLAFCIWIWTISPLSAAVGVASGPAFFDRLAMFSDSPPLPLQPIATIVVLAVGFSACGLIGRGLWNLAFGGPPGYVYAPLPPGVSNSAR